MNRHRHPVKYTIATAAIIVCAGLLTFGGVGARAVNEASAFFAGTAPIAATPATCEADVRATFNVYAATLEPIRTSTVTENAALLADAEAALDTGVANANCPPEIAEARSAFLAANQAYVAALRQIDAGSLTVHDEAYKSARDAASEAWSDFLMVLGLSQA